MAIKTVRNGAESNTRSIANRQQGSAVLPLLAWASCVLSVGGFKPVPIVSYWFSRRLDGLRHESPIPSYYMKFPTFHVVMSLAQTCTGTCCTHALQKGGSAVKGLSSMGRDV